MCFGRPWPRKKPHEMPNGKSDNKMAYGQTAVIDITNDQRKRPLIR